MARAFQQHVCDTSGNNHTAWVAVDDVTLSISGYKATVTAGSGSCVTRQASDGGKYNLAGAAESASISMASERTARIT
jgi:hypothetical protein